MDYRGIGLVWVVAGLLSLAVFVAATAQGVRGETCFSKDNGDGIDLRSDVDQDRWLGEDKIAHLTLSLFISGMCYKIYHDNYYNDRVSSLFFSGGFTLSLGLTKEFHDKNSPKDKFSCKDLIADMVGISIGLVLSSNH